VIIGRSTSQKTCLPAKMARRRDDAVVHQPAGEGAGCNPQGGVVPHREDFFMPVRWVLIGLFLAGGLAAGADQPAAATDVLLGPAGPLPLVDDAGRSVALPRPARRIISLAPSVTELLFALDAGDAVVAVTQACDYPPAALTKPRLGFASSAVEQMILLRPDLVVGIVGMVKPVTIEALGRAQIPLLLLEAKTLGDIYRHIRWLGQATGRLVDSDRLITHLEAQREALATRLRGVEPVPVLYVINDHPLVTIGPSTFISHVIELAGGRNVAASATGAYPQFSLEAALMADPDVILFPGSGTLRVSDEQRRFWGRWPTLRAVRQGRLAVVDTDLMDRPGPRLFEAAWRLAELLHPDRMAGRLAVPGDGGGGGGAP
jgi:iron complex transport system substrate-binding protein